MDYVIVPKYRIGLVREGGVSTQCRTFGSSQDIYNLMTPIVRDLDREHFYGLYLDAKHNLIALSCIAVGSLTLCVVHPRECFKEAILLNAAAIIWVHQHPSGNATPSPEDRVLTERLQKASEILGIVTLDHIILGDRCYISFADRGWLS